MTGLLPQNLALARKLENLALVRKLENLALARKLDFLPQSQMYLSMSEARVVEKRTWNASLG